MLEQQEITSLSKEIKSLTENIGFIKDNEDLLLTFSSKIYKNIKGIPILVIKKDTDLGEFITNFNIRKETESLTEEIISVMDFYNERRLFFTETDKQIVKDEVLQAVSELYKGILNYRNTLYKKRQYDG